MPLAEPIGLGPLPYHVPASWADWVAYMITYGWMSAAPVVPPGADDQHFDTPEDQHIGVQGDEHFDWQE
jgi:hypothetical protein